jgi:hypothetical protein
MNPQPVQAADHCDPLTIGSPSGNSHRCERDQHRMRSSTYDFWNDVVAKTRYISVVLPIGESCT